MTIFESALELVPRRRGGRPRLGEIGDLADARAIDDSRRVSAAAFAAYAAWFDREHGQYLRDGTDYYGRERRWPESPFWRRRQGTAAEGFAVPGTPGSRRGSGADREWPREMWRGDFSVRPSPV